MAHQTTCINLNPTSTPKDPATPALVPLIARATNPPRNAMATPPTLTSREAAGRMANKNGSLKISTHWKVSQNSLHKGDKATHCCCKDNRRVERTSHSLFRQQCLTQVIVLLHTFPMIPCKPRLADKKPKVTNPSGVTQLGPSRSLTYQPQSPSHLYRQTHKAIPLSPEKCCVKAAAMANKTCITLAKTNHFLFFAPILSPILPNDVPSKKVSKEQRACWSGL